MIRPVTSAKLKGKRVLLRAGFDVPVAKDEAGQMYVADDSRIIATLPTLDYLIQQSTGSGSP